MGDERKQRPLACTLNESEAHDQLDSWSALADKCVRTELLSTGVALWFHPVAEQSLRAVSAAEAACCGFLSLAVTSDDNLVRLQITSDDPEALPVIEALAAVASGSDSQSQTT